MMMMKFVIIILTKTLQMGSVIQMTQTVGSESLVVSATSDNDSSVGVPPHHRSSEEQSDAESEANDPSEVGSGVSAETVEFLYPGSELSSNEALCYILKQYVKEHCTKRSLDKDIKWKKKLLPPSNSLPASAREALKRLEELTSS